MNTFSVFIYSQPGESAEGIVKSPGNLSNAQIRQLSALRDASLQFVDDTSDDVSFAGTWERMDDELDFRGSTTGSDEADASAELTFSGIGVEVVVRKGRNGGLVDVELDGDVVLDDFDTYSRTTAFKQIIYTNKNLDAGSHTVRLVATGRKSAAATAADAMLDNFAVTMADTMRPRVLSVTSDASHPTKDSFTVTIDFLEDVTGLRAGEIAVSNGSVSNFAGSGASYTLDIAPIAGLEGEVTVNVPANAVVDGANNGNLEGSETFTVDTRAPVIQTAVANQAVLTLVYGEALDPLSVPPASAFTLTGGGAPRTISNIVVNGSRVVLSMDPPASYGEAGLKVGYSAPSRGALADALGNKVPSFTNQAVANESPGTTPSADTWITGATAFSVREGDTAVATLTATETATAAGDPVWWIPSGAAGGPDGGKFALSRAGVLTFAAAKDFEASDDANADGSYQVTVRLSVGALTAAVDLTVTLTNRNEAPVANARANQLIVAQGATVTLSSSGSDPDADDTLTYAWTQTGTPAVALSDTAAASPTFTAPSSLTEDTTLSFTLRVADSSGLYHEDTVSVTVQKDSLLTAAFENAPARHDGSTPFAVDLRFSDEVALWFSAFTSGLLTTTGGTVQRASRLVLRSNIGWRIPVTPDGDGDVVITLPANRACSWLTGACARDGRRLAVAASVTVPGPAPDPAAPDITSAAAFTVQEGETAVGTLAATDADTAAADLVWTIPSGTAGGADAGKFTLGRAGVLTFAAAKDFEVPDDANTDGSYQVTVQVSDGGLTDTANMTVSLTNVNEAPTAVASPTFTAPDNLTADAALTFALRVTDTAGLYHEDAVTLSGAMPGSVPFAVGDRIKTVTLATADDAVIESASTVTLTLASGAGYMLGSPASADVTVTDNDTATFRVSAAQNALDEGATTTVTVAITNGKTFAEAQSIAFSVSGSASTIDYELSSTSLTLAAGAVSASAMLTAVDDEAEESAETVAVTAAHDGLDIGSATVTIRASDAPLQEPDAEWGERLPDRDMVLPDGSEPTGLWSDGETLWVISDWRNGQVLTYSLAEGTALGEGEALLPDGVTPASSSFRLTGGRLPAGLWSDDETLWASDYFGGVRAYRLSDGTRLETQDISDDVLAAAGNTAPTGLWSDGETLWVTDYWQWKVFAYRLSDKVRVEEKEFDLMDGSTPYAGYGLWSDGESMWVAIERDNRIYAYAVPGLRKPSDSDASGTSDPFDVRVTSRADDVPGSAALVFMPDATLRQAVAAALGLGPYEAVGAQAMSALRSLDLRGAGVSDLTGLEYAVNLTGLDLSGNPVADLTPLGLLVNLRVLGLAGVEADPWPLFTLTGLRRLSLRDAGLSDISMLSGLTELEVLDLSGNPVSDLWPLAGMHRLGALRLDGGEVDISPLAGLGSLGTLEVGGAAPARPAPTPQP